MLLPELTKPWQDGLSVPVVTNTAVSAERRGHGSLHTCQPEQRLQLLAAARLWKENAAIWYETSAPRRRREAPRADVGLWVKPSGVRLQSALTPGAFDDP